MARLSTSSERGGDTDVVAFGDFCFDRRNLLLSRDGDEIELPPKVADLLRVLVDRPGDVVSKDDLLQAVWRDVAVTDNSLNVAVARLRRALGDDPARPACIQTVHGRGYRFIAPLRPASGAAGDEMAPDAAHGSATVADVPAAAGRSQRVRSVGLAAFAGAALVVTVLVAAGLLREFADQRALLEDSRERIGSLESSMFPETVGGTTAVEVWRDGDITASPSADGAYLSTIDGDSGDLALYHVASGEMRPLTRRADLRADRFADLSLPSPDGSHVAYVWYERAGDPPELRLIRVDGSGDRRLFQSLDARPIRPLAWLPDGGAVVTLLQHPQDRDWRLVAIPFGAGEPGELQRFSQGNAPNAASVSPDGKLLVYDGDGDIHVLVLQYAEPGALPVAAPAQDLIVHPEQDSFPFWAPDGSGLVFFSTRSGQQDLWYAPVQRTTVGPAGGAVAAADGDGNPAEDAPPPDIVTAAAPQRLFLAVGDSRLRGFDDAGNLYLGRRAEERDIWVAEVDPVTGRALAEPRQVTRQREGRHRSPAWSPDGDAIATVVTQNPWSIGILDLRQERYFQVTPPLARFTFLRWAHDGSGVVFVGLDPLEGWGIYFMEPRAPATPERLLAAADPTLSLTMPELRDGVLSYGRARPNSDDSEDAAGSASAPRPEIVALDLESNQESILFRAPEGSVVDARRMLLSPDRRWIAYVDQAALPWKIVVQRLDDGERRVVARGSGDPEHLLELHDWTPDSSGVLFTDGPPRAALPWLAHRDGTAPTRVELLFDGRLNELRIAPDGRRIAIRSRGFSDSIWRIGNVLPRGVR